MREKVERGGETEDREKKPGRKEKKENGRRK